MNIILKVFKLHELKTFWDLHLWYTNLILFKDAPTSATERLWFDSPTCWKSVTSRRESLKNSAVLLRCWLLMLQITSRSRVPVVMLTWRPCRLAGTSRWRSRAWRERARGWRSRSPCHDSGHRWSKPDTPAGWGTESHSWLKETGSKVSKQRTCKTFNVNHEHQHGRTDFYNEWLHTHKGLYVLISIH